MLLYLTEYLARSHSGFHVFQYLTLRGILAAMTALAMAMFIGPRMIDALTHYQIGQRVRTDGPQSHLQKSGTPTMGGGLILVAMVFATLLWADLSSRFVWILVGIDDRLRRHRLLRRLSEAGGRQFQGACRRATSTWRSRWPPCARRSPCMRMHQSGAETSLYVPFFKTVAVPMSTCRIRRVRLPRHRRHQQCRESHRRSRRPRHHARRDGGGGARRLRLCHGQHQIRHLPADSLHPRRRRGADLLRDRPWERASDSSGSTPIRPRSSWAMSARSRSAPRSAPSP